ncbi:MAG TPA: FlgD immunoglobulin-like domain containing protein [Gaiellaceae bacterium]|nr:FlgD immunoglobulin-like domain containing protein [Gaiellaceae bacterium]
MQRVLTTVTLLGLLVATAAAFAITEHLKSIKSPLSAALVSELRGREVSRGHVWIGPTCNCETSTATLRVKLRHSGPVTVTILDSSHHKVRTIATHVRVPAKTEKLFVWDGRTDDGRVAPDGVYHPSVQLSRRTFNFTNGIILDTKPPEVISATAVKRKPVLFVGMGRTVAIRYRFSEPAHAVVYLGGRQIIVGRVTRKDNKVKWAGTLAGGSLPAGRYVLAIGARDRAGNETPAAERMQVTVVVRYVQLSPEQLTVRGGGRLAVHVKTAAKRYTWRLGGRHGSHRGKVLHLRAPTTPGTYRIVVTENGHAATAVVRVHG